MIKYSIISSAFNEEENIPVLAEQFRQFNAEHDNQYELIIVDDGSSDSTAEKTRHEESEFIRLAMHKTNLGKTAGIKTGLKYCRGSIVVIYDTDMQYALEDVPSLIKRIETDGFDICTGWKQGHYKKAFVSRVYNLLSRRIFNLPIHDQNGLKAMKREVLDNIFLRKDWHRYIVSLAVSEGYSVCEEKVELHERKYGKSKYGNPFRVFIGIFDMMTVKFILSFIRKPMLFFGGTGTIFIGLGVITGIIALILRFAYDLGFRPLLYLVILFIVSGLILFTIGFLAEILALIFEDLRQSRNKRED